ncbi:MAG: ATP-binding protein [Patulibacter sp.]
MPPTLADRLARRDAERFVGRAAELELFEGLLAGDGSASVVLLHGPGGIGKSTLLREFARLAAVRGWSPLLLDGRELAPVPGELEAVFTAASAEDRPVVLLDTYERVSDLDEVLRQRLLPALPARSIVVLAGREAPASDWFANGWEHLARAHRLGPLSADEGRALVRGLGVVDEPTTASLVAWSVGSPLALTLATAVAQREGHWDGRDFEQRPELVEMLVRRLARAQVEDEHADVVAVAAIARVTTAALLADALPSRDPNEDYRWLRAQAIAEPVGDGLAMHALVRRAVHGHLLATRPERERELRRRIADHLFARAAAGEPRLTIDLAELIRSPTVRWGFGAEGAVGLHADALRPGELDDLPDAVLARGSDVWWAATRTLADASPEHFVVARDAHEALCGLGVAVTPANASPGTLADPFVGDWVRHAQQHVPDGDAMVWRDSLDLTTSERGDLGSRVLAVVNTAAVLRSGLVNPRYFYLPINPINAASVAFAAESGSRNVPELAVQVGELRHECHVIDYGPDGLLGSQRDTIYAELGLPRIAAEAAPAGAPSAVVRPAAVSVADVQQALRDLDRPSRLAVSPLAAAVGGEDPSAAVRALLIRAADQAFGAGAEETLMRDLVERAYVDHRTSHEDAAHELHVSRATYFRRLRQATVRVADYALASLASQGHAVP